MLHFVPQLVANCVCLQFGAEQVVCSGFLELLCRKQLPAAAGKETMRPVRGNQNNKVVGFRSRFMLTQ